MDSLLAPPPPLAPHLRPYRFWIWLQLILLRLYMRRLKGRGTPFLIVCDPQGNLCIAAIGDAPGEAKPDPFAFMPSRPYAAALSGELTGEQILHPCPRRRPVPRATRPVFLSQTGSLHRDEQSWGNIPLPET